MCYILLVTSLFVKVAMIGIVDTARYIEMENYFVHFSKVLERVETCSDVDLSTP